jgi:Rrf2 family protein
MRKGDNVLSQTAEYALRATLFLARHTPGRTATADSIAAALGAPANYLAKTLHQLARAGIVEGVRGPAGGFRLTRDAAELTLAEVVLTFDEPFTRSACLLGDRCDAGRPCAAHEQWVEVTAAMAEPLRRTMVADLLREDGKYLKQYDCGDAA